MAALASVPALAAATIAAAQDGSEQSTQGTEWWPLAAWSVAAVLAVAAIARVPWLRAMPRVGPAWPLRAEPSVLCFGAAFLATAIGAAAATTAFRIDDASPALARTVASSIGVHAAQLAVVGAALLVPAFRTRGASSVAGRGGVHRQPRGRAESVALAIAFAALLWPIAQAAGGIAGAIETWFGGARPALGHATLEAMSASGTTDPWWWGAVASAVLLAPLAEELAYRGLLQQGLKATGLPTWLAVTLTSALFALMHWSALTDGARAAGLVTLFALSAGWGALLERSGRISAAVIAHALFNAANLFAAQQA
jgi:membrane protease YdiL (CAAX protease family)